MYADGGSLYLRVALGGSKQWVFRYAALDGRMRDMSLGPLATIKTLAEARERATAARKLRLDGIDPIDHKRAQRASAAAAAAKAMTFQQCADGFIRDNEAEWTSAKHRQEWANSLASYVHPTLGRLPVEAIDTPLVLKVIKPLWERLPVTAKRVLGRIENVLGWATVHHYRHGDNPARWRGHLEHALPSLAKIAKVEHHAALPYAQIGAFMVKLRGDSSTAAACLQFIVLTAARLGEAVNAEWDEINFDDRVWIIPAARMKADREHRVPLSEPALAVLKAMQAIRHSDYVFPAMRQGRGPVGENTVWRLAKATAGADITVHGFRSSFRDWAAERTNFPREVAEMALAHAIPNAVEAAYRRGDLFEKRRRLMDAWAEFCHKPQGTGKVVLIAGADKRNPTLPPSLSRIRSAPAPNESEEDRQIREYANARIERENELRKKRGRGGVSIAEVTKLAAKLLGIDDADIGRHMRQADPDRVAEAMLAEDREHGATAPRKRGRPPTRHKHLWITHSIEAYIGTGLTRELAIDRAAENWPLARSTIDEIYRDTKLRKAESEAVRAHFGGDPDTPEDVDEAIRIFLEAERLTRE
jgi:integrase